MDLKLIKIILCPLFLLNSLNIFSQYNLNNLIDIAVKNNKLEELHKTNNELKINEYKVNSNLLPSISFELLDNANLGRSFDQVSGSINPRGEWFNTANFSLKLQQRFSNFFLWNKNKFILDEELKLNELNLTNDKFKLAIEISDKYFNLLLYDSLVKNSNYYKDQLLSINDEIKILFKTSKIDRIDTLKFNKEIITHLQDIHTNKIKYIENIDLLEKIMLEDLTNIKFIAPNNKDLQKILVSKEIFITEEKIFNSLNILDSISTQKIKQQNLFTFDLFTSSGTYFSTRFEPSFYHQLDINNFLTIGFKLTIPIYNYEQQKKVKILNLHNQISKLDREINYNKIYKGYTDLIENFNLSLEEFYYIKNKRKIFNEILNLNLIKFRFNKISLTDLIYAQIDAKIIEKEYLILKYSILKKKFVIDYLLKNDVN